MKFPFSAAAALTIFFAVLICGTAWRLMAYHLASSPGTGARTLGQAMSFQY